MKAWYKRLLCFGLMGVLLFTLVSAAQPAQAAASSACPTCPVNVGYVVAEHDWNTFEILHLNGVWEDDRIIGLKSSDSSLVEAETIPMDEGPAIHLGQSPFYFKTQKRKTVPLHHKGPCLCL